jgi:transposase InsO family protein
MALTARGRPPDPVVDDVRRTVLAVFSVMGPHVGLPTLRRLLPELSRGALQEMQHRFRYAHRRKGGLMLRVLRWHRPGAVWAIDFAEPPEPIDGIYSAEVHVRDLASEKQLMALPAPDARCVNVLSALDALARWVGLPLVLKLDNGPHFVAEALKAWAAEHEVLLLYSPPHTPPYNGAIEAGIGSMHVRAHYEAARHDRPGQWTCDDLEAARLQANSTSRPWGVRGPTPDEVFAERRPITPTERAAFLASYRRQESGEREARGIACDVTLQHEQQSSVDRAAIGRTLIEQGFLSLRRRRFPQPISGHKAARIW